MTIHLDALNGVTGTWGTPHIRKEVLELQPAFADGNAASTIIVEPGTVGVQTAFLDTTPTIVLKTALSAGRIPMLVIAFCNSITLQAAAAFGETRSKRGAADNRKSATVAQALPVKTPFDRDRVLRGQTAKTLAAQIKSISHML